MVEERTESERRARLAALVDAKNKIRGVIGSAARKGRKTKTNAPLDNSSLYREGVRKVLVESRKQLSSEHQAEFLTWVSKLRAVGLGAERDVLAFEPARPIVKSKRISVARELEWIVARLSPHLSDLREFRTLATSLDEAFWSGRENDAWLILSAIEARFGESIWSIELRLGLNQHYKGLDSQKVYLRDLRDRWRSGLPAYLAHFYSIRNEDRSTIRLFRDDVRER